MCARKASGNKIGTFVGDRTLHSVPAIKSERIGTQKQKRIMTELFWSDIVLVIKKKLNSKLIFTSNI